MKWNYCFFFFSTISNNQKLWEKNERVSEILNALQPSKNKLRMKSKRVSTFLAFNDPTGNDRTEIPFNNFSSKTL